MARALVIGSGVSGLATALFFTKLGLDVYVLEKSPRIGSLVRGFRRHNLLFETGFHYAGGLSDDGILNSYLKSLGLYEAGLVRRPLPLLGGETLRFVDSGQDILIPQGLDAFRHLFPCSVNLDAFFNDSFKIVSQSPFLNLRNKSFSLSEFLSDQGGTLDDRLAILDLPSSLKCLLGFRCLFYGAVPSESLFSQFAVVNTSYLEGIQTFQGGGEALIQSFDTALRQSRAVILTDTEVKAIKTNSNDEACAVNMVGPYSGIIDFDYCVFSGNPASLPNLLSPEILRPASIRRLSQIKQTPFPFIIFAHTGANFFAGRQLFICPNKRLESWFNPNNSAVYISGGPGEGGRYPLTIISFLSENDTKMWVSTSSKRRPKAYYDFKEQRAEKVRDFLLEHCPEFSGDLIIVDQATDLTLRHYSFASGGGIYGKSHNIGEPFIMPITKVGRLALAGQNIVLPGLLGAVVSAALAVGSLVGFEKLREVLT